MHTPPTIVIFELPSEMIAKCIVIVTMNATGTCPKTIEISIMISGTVGMEIFLKTIIIKL